MPPPDPELNRKDAEGDVGPGPVWLKGRLGVLEAEREGTDGGEGRAKDEVVGEGKAPGISLGRNEGMDS